jgi:UDP-glucose 4-epimerase
MRILITGGCGYLGGYFVKYLNQHFADQIDEVVLYDNLSRGDMAFLFGQDLKNVKIKLWENDILDRRNLLNALKDIDVVIHLAAKVSQPYTDVKLHPFDQVNNWGSSNLADAIDESEVKKAIYISSITAYGTSDQEIDESFIPEPQTYYGVSKLKGERHFNRIQNADVFVLRCANAYGYSPTMRLDSVFNRFMFEAHHNGVVNRIGDGTQSRAFVSLDSFSHQLARVALGSSIEPGTYNVADVNLSINEVLEYYFELFPELEVITIEQNVKLKSLNVVLPTKLSQQVNHPAQDVLANLKRFHSVFSF